MFWFYRSWWIKKEEGGAFYPCKPDIFEKVYEPILEKMGRDIDEDQPDIGENIMNERKCEDCKWCVETRYSFIRQMDDSIFTTIRNPAECHYHAANNYEYIDGERDVICNPFPLIDKHNYICSHFSLKPELEENDWSRTEIVEYLKELKNEKI